MHTCAHVNRYVRLLAYVCECFSISVFVYGCAQINVRNIYMGVMRFYVFYVFAYICLHESALMLVKNE